MDVPHRLRRGDAWWSTGELSYEGAKHEALAADPDVDLGYVRDGDELARTELDGMIPDIITEELRPTDPRLAVFGADRVLHLAQEQAGRGGTDAAYVTARGKQIWTGPATTYAAVVDETRQTGTDLVDHVTTLVHVPRPLDLDPDATVTRYVKRQALALNGYHPHELHHGLTTLDVGSRIPPAATDRLDYEQDVDELAYREAVDGLETGVASEMLRERPAGIDATRFG